MTEVTLFQLLSSRETRATKQKELLKIYGLPVISFTMNTDILNSGEYVLFFLPVLPIKKYAPPKVSNFWGAYH